VPELTRKQPTAATEATAKDVLPEPEPLQPLSDEQNLAARDEDAFPDQTRQPAPRAPVAEASTAATGVLAVGAAETTARAPSQRAVRA
jgi:hypothetical protein